MLRTSEEKRPVKRMRLSGSVASDLSGPVRDRKREFSGARSNYPVVIISGTPESWPGPADDNERSTLATPTPDDVTGSSFPTGRELSQGPGEIAQMAPTSTPSPVSLREQYGFRVESQIELGNEPGHSGIHYLLPSASIPSERANPRALSLIEQFLARVGDLPSGRVSTTDRGTVSSRPSPFSDPFPVVADRLVEGLPRHSVSDLNIDPEVDLSSRPTWEDPSWFMAAAILPQGWVQHQLTRQFALGIGGETPTPSVVNTVERIVRAVEDKTTSYVYSVDEDGAFSFDAWLDSGLFIMCEIDLYGEINAGLYHSPTGPQESFLPCITEDELLDKF